MAADVKLRRETEPGAGESVRSASSSKPQPRRRSLDGRRSFSLVAALRNLLGRILGGEEEAEDEGIEVVSTTIALPPESEGVIRIDGGQDEVLPSGARIGIGLRRQDGKALLYVQEPVLSQAELSAYRRLMRRIYYTTRKLKPGRGFEAYSPKALEGFLLGEAKRISTEYGTAAGYELTVDKLLYYVKRDLLGYGPINPLIEYRRELEDILVTGYGKPFVVMHRKFLALDWLETNIILTPRQQDALARRLALMGHSSLSVAFPVVECMLPTGERFTGTYMHEVSPQGTSMSIRLFKEEPLTIINLIEQKVLSPLMVAYLWNILENRGVLFVIGLPGSGKTTMVNAVGILLKPQWHTVTIEDFPELNLPQEYRHRLTARYVRAVRGEGGREQAGEIRQVHLLRSSLRIRPDFLIVGEILIEEAPVMFQAVNIGLGGGASFHATDVHGAVLRLLEKTIGVDPAMLKMIDTIVTVKRMKHPRTGEIVRRVTAIDEIKDVGDYNHVFTWDSRFDEFTPSDPAFIAKNSIAMSKITNSIGLDEVMLTAQLREKAAFLESCRARGIRNFNEFAAEVKHFYASEALARVRGAVPAAATVMQPSVAKPQEPPDVEALRRLLSPAVKAGVSKPSPKQDEGKGA